MTKIRFLTVAMTFCLCMVAFTSKTMAQTDVYVGGMGTKDGNDAISTVWKDGKVLYTFTESGDARVISIYVSDGDVYAVEYNNTSYVVWKNDEVYFSAANACPQSVFVYNRDVYIGGILVVGSNQALAVWKNGELLHTYTAEIGLLCKVKGILKQS